MSDLERQYKSMSIGERMELALSADLPDCYRPFLLRDQWMQIKCYFARRLDLQPPEIAALLGDQDHVIRLCIAKRADLTPEQVACCVNDRDPNVRYFIAKSPLISEAQRQKLLNDEDDLVRAAAKKGPREPKIRARPGQAPLIR